MLRRFLLLCAWVATATGLGASAPTWRPIRLGGEAAYFSVFHEWRAVVSADRGRLMYFGPVHEDRNLLLAPPTRANLNMLGGHRAWLGPQATWAAIWPPPAAWETEAPESIEFRDERLVLHMRDSGDGWPRLTRTYGWEDGKFICGVEIHGGTRPAQIIQILQVPPDTGVALQAVREPDLLAGYVQLPADGLPFAKQFKVHEQVRRDGDLLSLRHTDSILKLGVRPQSITATRGPLRLVVARGTTRGRTVDEPDAGFLTQIYLGGPEPFSELEQLSPRFAAGEDAVFEIVLTAEKSSQ